MYHETLIGWRKFISEIRSYDGKTNILLDYRKMLYGGNNQQLPWQAANDKEIVKKVMNQYKHQF